MKSLYFTLLTILFVQQTVFAEGAMNVSAQINSRMFSTQAAHQYETLEKEYYQNRAIRQIENRNYQPTTYTKQIPIENTPEKKGGLKDLFKGFRVIY